MNFTTFQQERLPNSNSLILKALFILVLKWERIDTYNNLQFYPDFVRLSYLHNLLKPYNYFYMASINPVEYTLIAKQIVEPRNREGLDKDFNKVDSDLLLDYLHNVNVASSIISLN